MHIIASDSDLYNLSEADIRAGMDLADKDEENYMDFNVGDVELSLYLLSIAIKHKKSILVS